MGKTLPNECPGYDIKQSDGEVLLELWGMWSTVSSLLLPGPLWPGVVAPDRVLSMSQIELNFSFKSLLFCIETELFEIELFWHLNCVLMLNWIICNKTVFTFNSVYCLVGWHGRIPRLHLCRGVRPPPNECLRYDAKQSDGEVPVMLEFWGM